MTMQFSQIRDQKAAVATLKRAVLNGKVAHAYLFEGAAGVGKKLTAMTLATVLNCVSDSDDACGECEHCRKISNGNHPDVRILTTPEGKRRIPIELVRESERWISVPPHEGRAKILIIDPAEMMTEPAANALLKTLEEPRSGSFLFLVTAASSALLPTIRSRCQVVRFKPLGFNTVSDILAGSGVDPEEAGVVAALASGSLDAAFRYSGDELESRIATALCLLEGAFNQTPEKAMDAAGGIRGDRTEAIAVLELMLHLLEALLEAAAAGTPFDDNPLVTRFGDSLLGVYAKISVRRAAACIAAVNRAVQGMERNNMNPQLALEGMVMAMRGRTGAGESWSRIGAR